jgi:hypothetical protein
MGLEIKMMQKDKAMIQYGTDSFSLEETVQYGFINSQLQDFT